MKNIKIRRWVSALALIVMFIMAMTGNNLNAKAADGDGVITVSDSSVKFDFTDETWIFGNNEVDYVIQQDSDVIAHVKNFKKVSFISKKYGAEFEPVGEGSARVLVMMRASDKLLEEAILYDISVDEDYNVTYEQLEHIRPASAARKGLTKQTKKKLIDEYNFSEDDLYFLGD